MKGKAAMTLVGAVTSATFSCSALLGTDDWISNNKLNFRILRVQIGLKWENTLVNWYLEIKIEEWPSRAKWGQAGSNGSK